MTQKNKAVGKIIKRVPLDIMDYAHKFKVWLLDNQSTYFEKYEAYHWRDFDFFHEKVDSQKAVTRRELVMPDEHLLIDRDVDGVHMYVICRLFGKVDGKARCKHIYPIIRVDELSRDFWRNGYFLLPDLTQPHE